MNEQAASTATIDTEPVSLDASMARCREVARQRARNFYYGMKLVPEPKRSAMYAWYAWTRAADDLADELGDVAGKIERIEQFRRDTDTAINCGDGHDDDLPVGPIWPALRHVVHTYHLPAHYMHDMLDGQLIDQRQYRYKTFEQLYDYCYKVASVVGLACIEIWSYEGDAETRKLAEWRGIAFQLTNILRDVLEDAQRDRVYLPAEDFDVFELSPQMFLMGSPPEAAAGIERVAHRAEQYYQKSAALDGRVHRDGRACLWAMTRIYRGLLGKILRNPTRVLSGKSMRLCAARKAIIALRATWAGGGAG